MVTAGIFPFKENSHGRAGNRTRDLMISSQRLWPLDHEAGRGDWVVLRNICVYLWTKQAVCIAWLCNMQFHIPRINPLIPSMAHRPSGYACIMVTKECKLPTSVASRQSHDSSESRESQKEAKITFKYDLKDYPYLVWKSKLAQVVDCVWNMMAHVQTPDFVFRRNGRVHLNRRGLQCSRLLAAEVWPSAVVMLDSPCSEAVRTVLATHSIHQFPLRFPSRASPCAITFQLDSNAD